MLSKLKVMTVLRQSLLIAEDWEYVPQRRFCRTPNPSQSKTSVSRLWNTHWSRHTAGTTTARGGSLPVALKDVWTYTLTGCSLDRCSHDRWSAKLESAAFFLKQPCGHHWIQLLVLITRCVTLHQTQDDMNVKTSGHMLCKQWDFSCWNATKLDLFFLFMLVRANTQQAKTTAGRLGQLFHGTD